MIETWFTSDTHFGHKKIIEYESLNRPFGSVEEMNEAIVYSWNMHVSKNDIVYHLGDFAFGKKNVEIASRLNGKKRLILGNHDTYVPEVYTKYFERLYGAFQWQKCLLTHIPVAPENLGDRYIINVHGHLHSKVVADPRYLNVSTERYQLCPINGEFVLARKREIESLMPMVFYIK